MHYYRSLKEQALAGKKASIFIGNQRPIYEVLGDRYVSDDIIDVVTKTQPGHLQETRLSRTSAQALLAKLVKRKKIQPNEYKVKSFKDGDTTRVFIVHEKEPTQGTESSTVHPQAAGIDIPVARVVADYVNEQEERRHSLTGLAEHFVGRQINPRTENATYHRMRNVMVQAQALITQEQGGKFTVEKVGHRKFYKWTK